MSWKVKFWGLDLSQCTSWCVLLQGNNSLAWCLQLFAWHQVSNVIVACQVFIAIRSKWSCANLHYRPFRWDPLWPLDRQKEGRNYNFIWCWCKYIWSLKINRPRFFFKEQRKCIIVTLFPLLHLFLRLPLLVNPPPPKVLLHSCVNLLLTVPPRLWVMPCGCPLLCRMSLTGCVRSVTPAPTFSCCASAWSAPSPSRTSLRSGSQR